MNKENKDWKEDYISIAPKSRLEKGLEKTEKVNTFLTNIPTGNLSEIPS